jgi:hypothetical protein
VHISSDRSTGRLLVTRNPPPAAGGAPVKPAAVAISRAPSGATSISRVPSAAAHAELSQDLIEDLVEVRTERNSFQD